MNTAVMNRVRLLTVTTLLLTSAAKAEIIFAEKANFTGRVEVSGKDANTTYYIWQSDGAGGWVNTGATITTNAEGNGSRSIANVSSGTLIVGHEVKIGSAAGPDDQPAKTVEDDGGTLLWPGNWFASVTPGPSGPHTVLLEQTHVQDGMTLLETWDAGTMISLRLDPAEAKWIDMGAAVVTTGDLSASLMSVTDEAVTVLILSDPTHVTSDDLKILGLGFELFVPTGAGVDFEWTGSSDHYLDGVFLESFVWNTPQSYEFGHSQPLGSPGSAFCRGDGTGAACPCGATGSLGGGCANTSGLGGAQLTGVGTPLFANDTFQLQVAGIPGAKAGLCVKGSNQLGGGNGNAVGDGLLCTAPQIRSQVVVSDSNGNLTLSHWRGQPFSTFPGAANIGMPTYYQWWYRDPSNPCSGGGFNFTNAWTVNWQ